MATATPVHPSTEIFNFEGQQVRTALIDGEPWFVLADVCKVLEITNSRNAKSRLSSEDVNTVRIVDGIGNPNKTVINEFGLYDVVLDSRKPQAKAFRRWVVTEVLPAIRKHGGYLTEQKAEDVLLNPDTIIQLAQNLKEERALRAQAEEDKARIARTNAQLLIEKEIMEPKAEAYDAWIDGSGAYLVGTVAKILNPEGTNTIGQNRLFKFLRDEGVLIKSGNRKNMPVQNCIKHFAVKTKLIKNFDGSTRVQATTFVRPSGVEFIANRLRNAGYAV